MEKNNGRADTGFVNSKLNAVGVDQVRRWKGRLVGQGQMALDKAMEPILTGEWLLIRTPIIISRTLTINQNTRK